MRRSQTVLKYSNKIITLLFFCLVAVMMTPRGNLAPWSFKVDRGLSQIESFTELLKTEKKPLILRMFLLLILTGRM